MRKRYQLLASVGFCALLLGCRDTPTSANSGPSPAQAARATRLSNLLADFQRHRVGDARMLEVAKTVPEFAGLYFDRSHRLTIAITDTLRIGEGARRFAACALECVRRRDRELTGVIGRSEGALFLSGLSALV